MRLVRWLVLPSAAGPGGSDRNPPGTRALGLERVIKTGRLRKTKELSAGEPARPLAALRGRAPRRGSVSEDLGTQGRRKEG